ncbi:hypothetical protein DN752_16920 [Echinicola strongylocentroti]|uniref:Lipocalin-like domain-containing protein n=1 Tax=Echinicola strongylocentroti TaxID=1795355 RepID=A0A2Z4ILB0_9BACT|nr:hypothetical protein [Echinicola strongylocentroti]AWW31674.1 hypothetical protein DN752_16920 [Echinicola strongylocentroti]
MKRLYYCLFASFSILLFLSCGGEDEPSPSKSKEQLALEKLTGEGTQTWIVGAEGSVTHKGQNATSDFIDFEITFSSSNDNKAYTTSNSNLLFDESGTWSFEGSNFDKIMLSGSQPAAREEIPFSGQGSNLRLEFNVPSPVAGRVSALAGDYVFMLKKK